MPFFNNTRDDFTHGHYQIVNINVKLIIFFVAENVEAVYSQQKTNNNKKIPRADRGIERGKTTRPDRYDLNQIPYEYTVEVMNRFKG